MANAFTLASETTASTSYTNLATVGPQVSVTTGTLALVLFACGIDNTVTNGASEASVMVTGASSVAASTDWSLRRDGLASSNSLILGRAHMFSGLTPGTNTFRMQYKVGSGTGSFFNREIVVLPF
jgi:hypothetical protein